MATVYKVWTFCRLNTSSFTPEMARLCCASWKRSALRISWDPPKKRGLTLFLAGFWDLQTTSDLRSRLILREDRIFNPPMSFLNLLFQGSFVENCDPKNFAEKKTFLGSTFPKENRSSWEFSAPICSFDITTRWFGRPKTSQNLLGGWAPRMKFQWFLLAHGDRI